MLLYPERGLVLNPTAADVLQRCDGRAHRRLHRGGAGPASTGTSRPRSSARCWTSSRRMADRGLVQAAVVSEPVRPYTLVAELTYRCPLRCVYCSNPLDYGAPRRRARHRHLAARLRARPRTWAWSSSTSPAASRSCATISRPSSRRRGGSTSTRTSSRAASRSRGSASPASASSGSTTSRSPSRTPRRRPRTGSRACARSSASSRSRAGSRSSGFPLTLNTVLHRDNLDRVEEVIALAERLGADRLELANAQYLGWALAESRRAAAHARAARARARGGRRAPGSGCAGRMEVLFVTPDYYADLPKACMDGWGRRFIVISPDGLALPCHAAHTLPGLQLRLGDASARWRRSGATSAGLHRLPRRGLDARAVPELRPARGSTSAAAAARRSTSPATPRPPIRRAGSRPITA